MLELSRYLLAAATVLLAVALLINITVVATRNRASFVARTRKPVAAGHVASHPISPMSPDADAPASTSAATPAAATPEAATPAPGAPKRGVAWASDRAVELSLVLMLVGLTARTVQTGHGPFSNQYEFACSFATGIVAAWVYFERRYGLRVLSLAVLPIALALLFYASTVGSEASPLMPALQNGWLLSTHVASAIAGYGCAAVSFGAAVLYLLHPRLSRVKGMPSGDLLDEIGYRAVVLTFPLLTAMLILGAIWADIAWGRYWAWDPKETAALVTWFIYGGYLHARVVRDWRGTKAAWLLVVGFAAILFTYFGNHWFGGMHSYV